MNFLKPSAFVLPLFVLCFSQLITVGCHRPAADLAPVRIATFNTALSRQSEGELHAAFATGEDAQTKLVAEVVQRTRPDIVLLQEVDYDPTGKAYEDFQRRYLSISQNGAEPITYEYVYAPPVNTGVLADVDLDGDGQITRPNDCYGYGLFEGQYGMVVLSRYPIVETLIEDWRMKKWQSLRWNHLPDDYYSLEARRNLRLSSKTHADVPVLIMKRWLRLWISHPTPPVFDGPEDRNGRRNFDEIVMWKWYLGWDVVKKSNAQTKDQAKGDGFFDHIILLGDLNADPHDGSSRPGAAWQILNAFNDVQPTSVGAIEASLLQAGANLTHQTDPATDTADWNDDPQRGSGNLRVDYVLPSKELDVVDSGVYWPTRDDPYAYLNAASDHKLVWIDVRLD